MMQTLVGVPVLVGVPALVGYHLEPVPYQAHLEPERCVAGVAVALLLKYILKRVVHMLVGVDPFLEIHDLVNLHALVHFQFPGNTRSIAVVQIQELSERKVLHDPKNIITQVNYNKQNFNTFNF